MHNLPVCLLHNRQINFVDINSDVPKSKRALCNLCELLKPMPIELALQEKQNQIENEFQTYNQYFQNFLSPVERKIKQLGVFKSQLLNIINQVEIRLNGQKDELIRNKELFLRSFLIDFDSLSITDIQNIGEELSQKNDHIDKIQEIKKQYDKKVEEILNLKEVKTLDQIQILLDQIKNIFQEEEFQQNLQDKKLEFSQFDQKEFKLDCYATCINKNETYIVASHNIELMLYEIVENEIRFLDKIHDIGFFYEIVFDQNDNNLLYLADYNSSLKIIRVENNKMKLLDIVINFRSPASCLVCTSKSEVIVSSQDLSFQIYQFKEGVFQLIQQIDGIEKEISSVSLSEDENLMATSHVNSKITIWQKQNNLWVIQQVINTFYGQSLTQSQARIRKDTNAVCFLNHNVLAYLSDQGIFSTYQYQNNIFKEGQKFSQPIDKQNHFPSTFTLKFNKKTSLLICHQYHKLEVFIQTKDGELELFQEFKNYRKKIIGCSLSENFMLAQDSEKFQFHILKLEKKRIIH
ncbi:unnamed protein product [Paramecium sonneborni]|uniref:WD40-repeat-containing domain n=1 Tax=Paramecium sonneborni TaxID=65129 RepID=A0A8S1Q0B9_9CILI|nr:unnamed protein product [Paramecium sonneborni]